MLEIIQDEIITSGNREVKIQVALELIICFKFIELSHLTLYIYESPLANAR